MELSKQEVYDFWNRASCGEELYLPESDRGGHEAQARARYQLEPFIREFANFEAAGGLRVLEIGVGLGADHQQFAENEADLYGIDLTPRAVAHTNQRLAAFGLPSMLAVGDAENLAFPDSSFDVVYSWGVLHHSPDTARAVAEVHRVLKPGGRARIMIYHKWSIVGLMLWTRYALLSMRPWRTLDAIYARYMESPGTKAYSMAEAKELFRCFDAVRITTVLSHGDVLGSDAGQRHTGLLLALARTLWPKRLIRRFLPSAGLFMMIEARK
jgi:ubiquinone/menaquinone biosynthesis C-methylase UbiE